MKDSAKDSQEEPTENVPTKDNEKERDLIRQARVLKRKLQREKKKEEKLKVPITGQIISFKEKGHDEWKKGRVVGSYKKTSKYKDWKHVQIGNDLIIERDFVRGIDEWKELADVEDIDLDLDTIDQEVDDQVFPVEIVPKSEYYRPEIQDAIQAEISKYKSFEAFEEVPDEGQKSVPTRWVVTKQKLDGKNQPFKARMCIRGDLERGKEYLRADAPTASKDALKLVLMLAANEGFKVQSGDIKSAFLQGAKIDRELFVRLKKQMSMARYGYLCKVPMGFWMEADCFI